MTTMGKRLVRSREAENLYVRAVKEAQAARTHWPKYFALLRTAASWGHVPAQANLGSWYLEGFELPDGKTLLPCSPRRGRALLKLAAARGDADAFFDLAVCYDLGKGGARSETRALYWYRRAIARGSAAAAYNVATIYRDRSDRSGQLRWLYRAIELGDDDAVVEFGRLVLLKSGRASAPQKRQAVWLLRKLARSASAEAPEAMLVLAEAYERGAGVDTSSRRAAEWRKKAQR